MKIKERVEYKTKSRPLSFKENDMVSDAIKEMSERNYGSVVIVDEDGSVLGIVSERDLMIRLTNAGKDPGKTELSQIMTREVRCANEDDDIIDWLRVMSNERFRHLPVINDEGRLISLMSQGDFVSYTWPELLTQMKDKTRESLGVGYQIALIVSAILVYSIIMSVITTA